MAEDGGEGGFEMRVGGQVVHLFIGETLPDVTVSELDGCFCLVRFVDKLGMQALTRQLKELSDRVSIPIHFLLYRKANEQDFKMSCPFCGQKLWVRDADLDKRGRCPSCKKGFTLPRQEDQVIELLGLRQDAPVYRVVHGDASSVTAAVRLFLKRKTDRDALMSTKEIFRKNQETMNVSLE